MFTRMENINAAHPVSTKKYNKRKIPTHSVNTKNVTGLIVCNSILGQFITNAPLLVLRQNA